MEPASARQQRVPALSTSLAELPLGTGLPASPESRGFRCRLIALPAGDEPGYLACVAGALIAAEMARLLPPELTSSSSTTPGGRDAAAEPATLPSALCARTPGVSRRHELCAGCVSFRPRPASPLHGGSCSCLGASGGGGCISEVQARALLTSLSTMGTRAATHHQPSPALGFVFLAPGDWRVPSCSGKPERTVAGRQGWDSGLDGWRVGSRAVAPLPSQV